MSEAEDGQKHDDRTRTAEDFHVRPTEEKTEYYKNADEALQVHLRRLQCKRDMVNHPPHYGGDTVYEAIKVIEAWGLNFNLGNAVKYVSRLGKKGEREENLRKAIWYLQRELEHGK